MEQFYSTASNLIKGSPIDNLMEQIKDIQSDSILFSVGSPSASNIPIQDILSTSINILSSKKPTFLNYEEPEGNTELRNFIVESKRVHYGKIERDNVLITSGCTQGFDLCCRLFLDKDDVVIIENPTYCISFSTAQTYGASVSPIKIDEGGLVPSLVKEEIVRQKKIGKKVKMIYVIPNAQNPSGVTLTLERRLELLEIAKSHNILIIEDDPYGELMFSSDAIPSLFSLDIEKTHVIHLNTFSKIIAPGFRTGWVVAQSGIIRRMAKLKHSLDSCTNSFAQHLIAEYGKSGRLASHICLLREDYMKKKMQMLKSLEHHFSDSPEVTWTNPQGGMFIWLSTKSNTDDLFFESAKNGVVFIPGSAFHPLNEPSNHLRLCYSSVSMDEIDEGVKRLKDTYISQGI